MNDALENPMQTLHILRRHKTIDNKIATEYVILERGTGIVSTAQSAIEIGRNIYRVRVSEGNTNILHIQHSIPDDHSPSFYSDFSTLDNDEKILIGRGYRMEKASAKQVR